MAAKLSKLRVSALGRHFVRLDDEIKFIDDFGDVSDSERRKSRVEQLESPTFLKVVLLQHFPILREKTKTWVALRRISRDERRTSKTLAGGLLLLATSYFMSFISLSKSFFTISKNMQSKTCKVRTASTRVKVRIKMKFDDLFL